MRSVTIAEAERDLAGVLETATREPVRIERDGSDWVVVSGLQFQESQELLRKNQARRLQEIMKQASEEAKANGLTEEILAELLRDLWPSTGQGSSSTPMWL
jgi:PHD/YefM family antitoxin component YafN of YafNO toxin-antitoxin module